MIWVDRITLRGISGEGAVGAAHGVVHGDRKIARDAALGKEPHGGAVAATAQQHVVAAECDDAERFKLAHRLVGRGIAQRESSSVLLVPVLKIIAGDRFRRAGRRPVRPLRESFTSACLQGP